MDLHTLDLSDPVPEETSAVRRRVVESPQIVKPENLLPVTELKPLPFPYHQLKEFQERKLPHTDWLVLMYPHHGWYLSQETELVVLPSVDNVDSADQRRRIGLGQEACPLCKDSKLRPIRMEGKTTGIRLYDAVPCKCGHWHIYWPVASKVPERYQGASLATLTVSKLSNTEEK